MTLPPLSQAGMQVQADIMNSAAGPVVLAAAWSTQPRKITRDDLATLIQFAWSYFDSPTSTLDQASWIKMFRDAGQLVVWKDQPELAYPLRIFRGASENRWAGMSWSLSPLIARQHCDRRRRLGKAAAIYQNQVSFGDVLALFNHRGEQEVVVDPSGLGPIERYE